MTSRKKVVYSTKLLSVIITETMFGKSKIEASSISIAIMGFIQQG